MNTENASNNDCENGIGGTFSLGGGGKATTAAFKRTPVVKNVGKTRAALGMAIDHQQLASALVENASRQNFYSATGTSV